MKIKYMGSKRQMLQNGLGAMIRDQSRYAKRIVDLFCGASPIAWFAAENTQCSVLAVDLQMYAVTLAKSVIARTAPLSSEALAATWLARVERYRSSSKLWQEAISLEDPNLDTLTLVCEARNLCERPSDIGPVWHAYGGYYFSPSQAITFDYL